MRWNVWLRGCVQASGLIFLIPFFVGTAAAQTVETPPLAGPEEVEEAHYVLEQWVEAFQQADYDRQWELTDYRIRRWRPERVWQRLMTRARRDNGALLSRTLTAAGPVDAQNLPCTEQGHCTRQGVQYVIFVFQTEYEIAAPPQPEYVVMAHSSEGWRVGGGTLLNRPMHETMAILDRRDERRMRPSVEVRE